MKNSKNLFLMIILVCGPSKLFTINFQKIVCAGLCAISVNADCTVYNTMKEDVTVQNSHYGFVSLFSDRTVPLATVKIPAEGEQDILQCIHLDILSDHSDSKIVGLDHSDQPHGHSRAFTVSQEPCWDNCNGATKQIILTPGLPASYFKDSITKLSPQQLVYATHQLEYNLDTVIHNCNLRGAHRKK